MQTTTGKIINEPLSERSQQAMEAQILGLNTKFKVRHDMPEEHPSPNVQPHLRDILAMLYRGYRKQIVMRARTVNLDGFCVSLAIDMCINNPGFVATIHEADERMLDYTFETTAQYTLDRSPHVQVHTVPVQSKKNTLVFNNGSRLKGALPGSVDITNFNLLSNAPLSARYYRDEYARTIDAVMRSSQEHITIIDTHPDYDTNTNPAIKTARTMYERAKAGKISPASDFWFSFVPWWAVPYTEFRFPFPIEEMVPARFEHYFAKLELQENIKLTFEQKLWYYIMAEHQCLFSKAELLPSTLNEALYPQEDLWASMVRH